MAEHFSYLLDKITSAEFQLHPFKHIYIENFFTEKDFIAITSSPEVALSPVKSDEELFDQMFARGYKIIDFPGCITDHKEYIEWRRHKGDIRGRNKTSCEGFGVTFRLDKPQSEILGQLRSFLDSEEFNSAVAQKFQIPYEETYADAGLQKYLDGYEISPHPDIRKKALTYMVNINPHDTSEHEEHHTHYLTFKPGYKFVEEFWRGNPKFERCWVPWNWCDTASQQRKNNSIVIFSPSDNTLHAVKANYDHRKHQRTQLYGNLWYHVDKTEGLIDWEDFQIDQFRDRMKGRKGVKQKISAYLPPSVKAVLKTIIRRNRGTVIQNRSLK